MSILDYEPEELIGRSAAEFVFSGDLEKTRRQMRMARRSGVIRNFESRYIARSGQLVTLAWMGVWSQPEQQHFFIGRDTTAQKAAQDTLRQSLERQQAMFNSAPVGILTLNESGSIESINPAGERTFGVTADVVLRRDIGRLVDLGGPSDISAATQLRRMMNAGDGARELTGFYSNGSTFPIDFLLSAMPVGQRHMFVVFVRNITNCARR